MASVITVSDVQHWGACRRVTLAPDATLTESARRWLTEHQVEVEIASTAAPGEVRSVPQMITPDTAAGEALLEVQLLRWVPRVMERLGAATSADAVREAVRTLLQTGEAPAGAAGAPGHGAPAEVPPRQRAIITVLGKDRVGIIAAITSLLSARQANVLDINQTLFGDLFSMNMAVDISRSSVSFASLKEALEQAGEEMQLQVLVQREAVFDYMHRV